MYVQIAGKHNKKIESENLYTDTSVVKGSFFSINNFKSNFICIHHHLCCVIIAESFECMLWFSEFDFYFDHKCVYM